MCDSRSQDSVISAIHRYQKSLDHYTSSRNDGKLLYYMEKLSKLPVKVAHLEETGVGRTVNSLRKLGGEVGDYAKQVVVEWKQMVVGEQEEAKEAEDGYQSVETSSNSSEESDSTKPVHSSQETRPKHKERHSSDSHKSHHKRRGSSSEEEVPKKRQKHRHDEVKHKRHETDDVVKHRKHEPEPHKRHEDETKPQKKHEEEVKHHKRNDEDDSKRKSHRSDESKHKKHKSERHKDSRKDSERSREKEYKSKSKDKEKREKSKAKNGIDSGSGASFAEALGMCEPSSSKSSGKRKSEKREKDKERERPKAEVVVPKPKEEPLVDLNIASLLPLITPIYKPLGVLPVDAQAKKPVSEYEALSTIISSKNQRTKVYSGNKTQGTGTVPSLFELSSRILQDHIDNLEYTGGVPFIVLKAILEKASPTQLHTLEHHNPYLIEDTDELWKVHCQREFRNKKREEMETWREMYLRCLDERDAKLKTLTANIKQSQDKSLPVRMTKLAYVDAVAKPPRNIARKQLKNGTIAVDRKAVKIAGLATSGEAGKIVVPSPSARVTDRASIKPKKAPLMLKSISSFKNRFKR